MKRRSRSTGLPSPGLMTSAPCSGGSGERRATPKPERGLLQDKIAVLEADVRDLVTVEDVANAADVPVGMADGVNIPNSPTMKEGEGRRQQTGPAPGRCVWSSCSSRGHVCRGLPRPQRGGLQPRRSQHPRKMLQERRESRPISPIS